MAHLVFSGVFERHPDIKIITHYLGGIIPYLEGKVAQGKFAYTRLVIDVVEKLDITQETRNQIYEGNARKLLRL